MAATTVILGGKGAAALSAEQVYNVAHCISKVQIDSAALQKLSKSSSANPSQCGSSTELPHLSPSEYRAALVVLLNKLLQAHVRAALPLFIEHVLNCDVPLSLPASDSAVASGLVAAIEAFKGEFEEGKLPRVSKGDLFVSEDEVKIIISCSPVTVGVSALCVYSAGVLCVLGDAVAALSCEAVQLNIQKLEMEVPAEGVSNKSELEVSSDIRTLLFGSKMVTPKNPGFDGDSAFYAVLSDHGLFRENLKSAQGKVRTEINTVLLPKKVVDKAAQPRALRRAILDLAFSLKAVGENSICRVGQLVKAFSALDGPVQENPVPQQQPTVDGLNRMVQSIFSNVVVFDNKDRASEATEVLALLQEVKQILAWEVTAALSLIFLREERATAEKSVQTASSTESGGNAAKQKGEKKKKSGAEIVLGKGTATIKQTIIEDMQKRIQGGCDSAFANPCLQWAQQMSSYFDPKDQDLQSLIGRLKDLLQSNEARRLPKIPKGTRDFKPEQMAIRERAFSIIVDVFKRHGAVALDTPVFELRETLMGKYGEDSKLIYDLADQGGEICSLRYDLTVPFARYLAMHNISSLKRYHIARVYRRDNPSKGRYREFYQCDFDIAGPCEKMLHDFEVIKVLTELLDELDIGQYEVKLNHRKLLDGMLEICGVPKAKFRSICSAIDKLDKQSWDEVEKEMVEEKGLDQEVAKKIGGIVLKKGSPLVMLNELRQDGSFFSEHEESMNVLQELETLFQYLEESSCIDKVVFDLSLARGLDYYTGVIYEAVFKGTTQVGSIAAGGRYDDLVGMFSGKKVAAVGVSLGIERVFTIMEQRQVEQGGRKVIRATQTSVLVVVCGDYHNVAIKLVSELWAAKVKAEFVITSVKKIGKCLKDALDAGIPFMLIMGEAELNRGVVKLKNLKNKEEQEVPRDKIVEEIMKLNGSDALNNYVVQ